LILTFVDTNSAFVDALGCASKPMFAKTLTSSLANLILKDPA
jgi:hypothetical protein